MPVIEACNHSECSTIDDMVSFVLKIAQNFGGSSNPIIVATFSSFDEETQFMRSLHHRDAGTSFFILQESEIPVLFCGQQCRFVSPGNIVEIMRLSGNLSQPGDILVLRRPTDPFMVAYFATYLTACYRIGLSLVGLITFVSGDFNKEIMF